MLTFFMFPNRVIFGPGASGKVGKEAKKMGVKSVLLVTDPGLQACGLSGTIEDTITGAGLGVSTFGEVVQNPDEECVRKGMAAYDAAGADGIVALGGGSAMDTAKAIGLMMTHPAPLSRYDSAKGGMARISDLLPPVIAIPTTAGTGSEISSFSVITDSSQNMKLALGSPYLIPKLALVDPALTLELPREITINTGVDALTHLIEGYVSTVPNPMMDRMALFGLEALRDHLRNVVRDPGNLESRSEVMMAAMTGALVYNQKFLGMNHSMAHSLSAVYGLPHGLANGLVLPFTMRFNQPVAAVQYEEIGKALGGTDGIEEVKRLLKELGMKLGLRHYGIKPDDIELLATKAFEDPSHGTNPRQPVGREDFDKLFREAYEWSSQETPRQNGS